MKVLILIAFALNAVVRSQSDYQFYMSKEEKEYHRNKGSLFKEYLFPFNKRLALGANYYSNGHFIISAHSIWYVLGISGDTDGNNLFKSENVTEQTFMREQFPGLALQLEGFGEDISFVRSRAIAIDETVNIRNDWASYKDLPYGAPEYLRTVKYDKPFGRVQKYLVAPQPRLPMSGHAVFVDNLIFDGVWSPEFSKKPIQQGPFCNGNGEQIATVEYLRMKDRVHIAEFPDKNVKVLEVPIGTEGMRTMVLAVGDKAETLIETVFSEDIFSKLKLTEEPIEVAVPRLLMSSGLDMGPIFKDIKRTRVSDPVVYRSLPNTEMGYFQLVSVNMTESAGRDGSSLNNVSPDEIDFAAFQKDGFIANRPFLFSLFVTLYATDIKVPVFTGVYSYPGERGQQRIFY